MVSGGLPVDHCFPCDLISTAEEQSTRTECMGQNYGLGGFVQNSYVRGCGIASGITHVHEEHVPKLIHFLCLSFITVRDSQEGRPAKYFFVWTPRSIDAPNTNN